MTVERPIRIEVADQVGSRPRAPGLHAVVAYLRPARRGQLLPALADLGVFIHELTPEQLPELTQAGRLEADLVIAVVGSDPAHARIVKWLASSVSPALLALCPNDESARDCARAGAVATARDWDPPHVLAAHLAPVARMARSLRDSTEGRQRSGVFGDLRYREDPARLEGHGRTVLLTSAERTVLTSLSQRVGEPVDGLALEQLIARPDGPSPTSNQARTKLKSTVFGLRRKAEALGGDPMQLGTVRGYGYILRG